MKSDLCFEEKGNISREILYYLVEHPEAQDTLEGIAQWWLLERKIRYQIALVSEAISGLVRRGLIVEQEIMNSKPRYRINSKKLTEIKKLCEEDIFRYTKKTNSKRLNTAKQ